MTGAAPGAPASSPLPTALMLVLTFSTGVVDAVGFLSLEHTFAANMTGNLVMIGLGLIDAVDTPLLGPLAAVLAFVAGASSGSLVVRLGGGTRRSAYCGFHLTGGMLAAVAVWQLLHAPAAGWEHVLVVAALGLAMGAQAALARRVAVPDVNTIVVTLPLTAFGSRLVGAAPSGQRRRIASVLLLTAGAIVGGLLSLSAPWAGIALSAALSVAVGVVGACGDARRVAGG